MTDAEGNFEFSDDGSNSMLRPRKRFGSNCAITAEDATYVLGYVAGLHGLSPNQRLAADVTGDSTVTALDADYILRFAQGQLLQFPVACLCDSDWVFVPDPSSTPGHTRAPQVSGGQCVMGEISYPTLTPPTAGQDFVAILFGDVNGDWSPEVATPCAEGTPAPTCSPTALETPSP